MKKEHPRSSRQRYRVFVEDYKHRRIDDAEQAPAPDIPKLGPGRLIRGKQREYLREYLRWLRPQRYAVAVVFVLALLAAGLQMIEPLFMRYMIDQVLLNTGLDSEALLMRLHMAGAVFLGVIVVTNLINGLKDYRQRLLNTRVMLTLRRSLFHRLLHLPLPKLWDMKTGGILSRLTGDVDTTTGLF